MSAIDQQVIKEILDLGTGEGEFIKQMREIGYKIIGVDVDPRSSDNIAQAEFENLV